MNLAHAVSARPRVDDLLFPDAMRAELAVRAAALLAVRTGSTAVLAGQPVERLTREAMFLLVFGSRPAIKSALLDTLGGHYR